MKNVSSKTFVGVLNPPHPAILYENSIPIVYIDDQFFIIILCCCYQAYYEKMDYFPK